MTKLLFSILGAVVLLSLPLHAQPKAAPYTPTPLDYYRLGQFFETTTNSMFFIGTSKTAMRQQLGDERKMLVKLGASQAVLDAYNKLANVFSGLPFSTSWSTWTKDQQNAYLTTPMDWGTINAWLPAGDSMPRFYFWLGYQTMFIARTASLELNSWGTDLPTVQAGYKSALSDFNSFATTFPNTLKTAIPSVQAAIQALALWNGKTPEQTDVATLAAQAEIIYDVANGKIAQ